MGDSTRYINDVASGITPGYPIMLFKQDTEDDSRFIGTYKMHLGTLDIDIYI